VIPQRNISLLSNRLAASGAARIREDVLERDYCLAWLLSALAQSDLRPVLAFKGGTALKRCYFADYRNPLGSPNQNRFERRSALMVRTASDHTRTTG
jgi:predicted nucleotidyltransferase component of viral defense system